MSPFIAFHDGQILMEADHYVDSKNLPQGSYVRWEHESINGGPLWYFVMKRNGHSNASGINHGDIPDWIKTYLLII